MKRLILALALAGMMTGSALAEDGARDVESMGYAIVFGAYQCKISLRNDNRMAFSVNTADLVKITEDEFPRFWNAIEAALNKPEGADKVASVGMLAWKQSGNGCDLFDAIRDDIQ